MKTIIIIILIATNTVTIIAYRTKPQVVNRQIIKESPNSLDLRLQQSADACIKQGGVPIYDRFNGFIKECQKL